MKVDTVGIYARFAPPGQGFPPIFRARAPSGRHGQAVIAPPAGGGTDYAGRAIQITPAVSRKYVRNGKQNTAEVSAMHYHK